LDWGLAAVSWGIAAAVIGSGIKISGKARVPARSKNPALPPGSLILRLKSGSPRHYLASLASRLVSRDTLRLAAFGWITPFCEARMITGSASFNAAAALLRSPEAKASSTLPKVVRRRERRDLLIAVRRAMTRVAFLAELVFAMCSLTVCGGRHRGPNK
jgi:hypothetical protein